MLAHMLLKKPMRRSASDRLHFERERGQFTTRQPPTRENNDFVQCMAMFHCEWWRLVRNPVKREEMLFIGIQMQDQE